MTTPAAMSAAGPAVRSDSQRRIVALFGTLAAAAVGFLLGFWIWRGLLGIPYEYPVGGITLDGSHGDVRPWAPWWLVPCLVALVTGLAWRLLAVRAGGVSLLGSAVSTVFACILSFPISTFALELGAIAQYVPTPPIGQIVKLVPTIVMEAAALTMINLVVHGIVIAPSAAILGLMVGGFARAVHRKWR